MKIRPLFDRVLVQRVIAESTTAGGIIIPESAKEKPQEGNVVAVGAGRRNEGEEPTPLTVAVGDRVLFGKFAGSEIKLDGVAHVILREEDILGIIEK